MTSFRFAIALIAMVLVSTATVKANDLTVGDLDTGSALGSASATRFAYPYGVEVLQGDEVALVTDNNNFRIVNVSLADGSTNEFMTTGTEGGPKFLAVCDDGVGYYSTPVGVQWFNTKDTLPTALPWLSTISEARGLACLKNSTHDLLFVSDYNVAIRAYDRSSNSLPASADDFVWEVTVETLGVSNLYGISVSPDLRHLAFASWNQFKVGTISLETNDKTIYGSGTHGDLDGAANVAQFVNPFDVAWTPDGSQILVNQQNQLLSTFSGLRFIDFATGAVTSSADGLMPSGQGRGVTVVRSTGDVVVIYEHGLKKMQVAGVTAAPSCGNVPTVGNSDGGNNATAIGFVGDTVTYVCEAGFAAAGTSQITTCQFDTLTWSTVSGCQSVDDVIIGLVGNSADVESTLEAVNKAFGKTLCGGATSEASLKAWFELREFQ